MIQINMKVVLTFQCMIYIVGGHTYNTADLSQFGNCAILIKRFQDNTNTIDITSLVAFNQISSKQYSLLSVYNANKTIIQPISSVKEECSLNVIIGIVDYNLPYLLEELNASKLAEINGKIKPYTAAIWNNPNTLTKNRSAIFGIATSNAKTFLKQRLNSLTPQHCLCSEVRDLRSTFRVYSFCWHRLRYRIFRNLNFIEAAGFDLFLDWEIERAASDFAASKDDGKGVNTLSDFLSFKNLIPLLIILGCILIFSFICFLFEFRRLFCRVQITCTFPK
jgi:hypothetical protein